MTGDPAVTAQQVMVGDYDLSEDGPGGYEASDWSCVGGTLSGASVSVQLGADVTCTITNDDEPAILTLVKVVDNGTTGATTGPGAWTLAAGGPVTVTGASGTPAVTAVEVPAGGYDLSESGGPGGYTASAWTCTGGALLGATVSLVNGDDATCTITNTAVAPRLTLVKEVVNDDGGTNVATDWTLTADGPAGQTTPVTGPTGDPAVTDVPVVIGDYDLSETAGAAVPTGGYTASDWDCTGADVTGGDQVTVGLGDDVTCTITNDDNPATLTLVKVVDGDAAGSGHVPADWTLTADGPTTVTGNGDPTTPGGVDAVEVPAGAYDLSEDGPAGFDPGDWVCEGGVAADATVTVPLGGDVTCTITNTAVAPTLTLIKVVDNGDTDGTATPTDWRLAADGPSPISGLTGDPAVTAAPVKVGDYDLSESGGPDGYTASDWVCEGADVTPAGSITLAEGDAATCTITNTAQPGRWTVSKSSDPVSGSTVQPGDVITYTVTASKLGGVDPTDLVVTDDLSQVLDNATLVDGSITTSTGTATASGTALTWNIPTLSGDETVTYQVRVNDGAYGVTLRNLVTGEGAEPCVPPIPERSGTTRAARAVQEDCDSTVHKTPKWTLVKSSDPKSGSTVQPGSRVTYTLTATNVSESPVTAAVVKDDLSDVLNHATLLTVPDGATLTGSVLTWTVPELPAQGDSATLTYTVRLDSDADDVTIRNVATPGPAGVCETVCTTTHETPPSVEPPVTPPNPPNPPNPPGPSLPGTGGPAAIVLGVGLLLLLAGAGLVLGSRRRRLG